MEDDLFLPGLPVGIIRTAYLDAPGNEIESGKFASPESSAALVANAFGLFLDDPAALPPRQYQIFNFLQFVLRKWHCRFASGSGDGGGKRMRVGAEGRDLTTKRGLRRFEFPAKFSAFVHARAIFPGLTDAPRFDSSPSCASYVSARSSSLLWDALRT